MCPNVQPVLFVACAGTEMWYVSLFVLAHDAGPPVGGVPFVTALFAVCTPVCIFKQLANVVQMYVACHALAVHDAKQVKQRL